MGFTRADQGYDLVMLILGIILIIAGALLDIGILYTIGAILAVIGLVLWVLSSTGRAFSGRRFY
ncbi:hypothetical protein [Euzebya sp.]|uniref:hypothetical protein n=1 Tax=Euzebya sp. TaxID=1971409 RepID=UPI0035123B31